LHWLRGSSSRGGIGNSFDGEFVGFGLTERTGIDRTIKPDEASGGKVGVLTRRRSARCRSATSQCSTRGGMTMSRRQQQKCPLQVEKLEARDTPSVSFPLYAGIVRAGAVVAPQAVAHSAVCLNPVVDGSVLSSGAGFVPAGQVTARIMSNHNETFVRDRTRATRRR
jgi:hypothetical protein